MLSHSPSELAPVIVRVVVWQVEILGYAVGRAIHTCPAWRIQNRASQLTTTGNLVVEIFILAGGMEIQIAGAGLLHLAPPEEDAGPLRSGGVGHLGRLPGLVDAKTRLWIRRSSWDTRERDERGER